MKRKVKKIKNDFKIKTQGFWTDFKKFISKGNIIDLAIAVVIGAAFGKIVSSLVSSVITPLTSLFLHSGDISHLKWVLTPEVVANEAEGIAAVPEVAITYGLFIQAVLDFIIIALVIFIILKIVLRINNRINAREIAAAKLKEQEESEKKNAEKTTAAALLQHKEDMVNRLYSDVALQAKTLTEIKEILLKNQK